MPAQKTRKLNSDANVADKSVVDMTRNPILRFVCPGCSCRFSSEFQLSAISKHLARCLPKLSNVAAAGADSLREFVSQAILISMLPHQYEAVQFLRQRIAESSKTCGCVIADGMGTGKTLSCIALVNALARSEPKASVLVVAPCAVIGHWEAEYARWMPPHQAREVF